MLYQCVLFKDEARLTSVFKAIVDILRTLITDSETVSNVFAMLTKCFRIESQQCGIAFEKAGGLDLLEKLQTHANEEIRRQSSEILVRNFELEQ